MWNSFSLSARNLLVQLANKNLRRNYATCVHATSKFSAKLTYGRRTRDSTFILGRFFQGTNPISPSHQDEGWQWVGRGRRWVGVTDIIWVFAVCMCVRGSWTIVWALFKGCGYEYRAKWTAAQLRHECVCECVCFSGYLYVNANGGVWVCVWVFCLQPRLFGCAACVPWARVRTRQQHQPLCPIFKRSLFETNFPRRRRRSIHPLPQPKSPKITRKTPKPSETRP